MYTAFIYFTLPFPERREVGRRRRAYRDLQTFLASVCGDQFVALGYFVCTVLEVGFRAVPSKSQALLLVVVAFSAGPKFMMYFPVYEVALNFRLSLVWMVQFG